MDNTSRNRLDAEWAFLNAARELMNIARRSPDVTTYRQAMGFGEAIAPSLLGRETRVMTDPRESEEAILYREQATAETARQGKVVTALDLIGADIEKFTLQTDASPDAERLKGKLKRLKIVKRELTPKRHTENQLIFRDAIKTRIDLPVSGAGADYVEYAIDEDRALRVRVVHPDPPEHKTGADLIYEYYNVAERTVRLTLIQYKVWNGNILRQDDRMKTQLERLEGIGCKGQFCYSEGGENQPRAYRFPYCFAFLRPTDRLQSPNAKWISSGMHVPICAVQKLWTSTERGGLALKRANIAGQAVSHRIFEELFNTNMLGTRLLDWDMVEEFYRDWGIFDNEEVITLHAQEVPITKRRNDQR